MNLKDWMRNAVIYQRHFVHNKCLVYAKANLNGLYLFVDIAIDIDITCGAVIVTCDQTIFFGPIFLPLQKTIKAPDRSLLLQKNKM